jgi:membrane-associated phospholipid phosphatase
MMRMRVIVLAFSCAASSLTLTAPFSMSAPPQEQEQRVADSKENSSDTKAEMTPKKRITIDLETEPFENSQPGFSGLGKRFLDDQKQIWTSPAKVRFSDTQWLVPIGGITAGLFVTDVSYSRHLSQSPSTISHYKTLSNASVGALIGGAGGMWLLGHVKHNDHWSETGFLAGEAAINSLVAVEAMKYSLGRQRPFQGDGSGPFFHGGTSFPSEHAAAAWSVAGVIAHEYPGPLTKIMAYGLASLVDYSRVRGHQHFPSDVFVGSIMGNLIAQNIYSRRHNPQFGGGEWRSFSQIFRADGNSSPANQGSPYVPLDSWIYPALDRLAGMGLIKSAFEGMKPWTRNECVRLLGEAGEHISEGMGGPEAEKIYQVLETELRGELESADGEDRVHAKVESVYARVTNISGQPLTDGNHFGQTITNDFGRLYQEGVNSVEGFSAWTTSGHWVGYIRAEYQHAPSAPADSLTVRQFIGSVDGAGIPPATPFSTVNRVRLLDTYVGLTFNNWQMSYGKQSLWWSPMQSGPLMFGNNADPVTIFRISRVSPFKLPSILGWLGPIRAEWFIGQFAGHEFTFRNDFGLVGEFGQSISRQPFLHGQKFSFKPTKNLEFSVSLTVVLAGGPVPLTWHNLLRSYSGLPNSQGGNAVGDEGDGRSGVDFSYKIPGLRNWLTFYGDAMTEDEISPLGYPRKSAFQGGLYLARIPGIPKLDLRVEGGSTAPVDFPTCQGCFYVNARYPDGSYANHGNLVGSSLGRAGQGERAWSTYWFSPRDKIQFQYRHLKVNGDYLQQGGTLNDGGVGVEFQLRPQITFSGSLQYEDWNYPVVSIEKKSNWATSVGFTFWPKAWK